MSDRYDENMKATVMDVHDEQLRQSIILKNLQTDVKEIHCILVGSDKRQGLVMDVDRLKRGRAMIHSLLVIIMTAVITGGIRMFFTKWN